MLKQGLIRDYIDLSGWWSDYAGAPNRLPSNKVISRVSYPQRFSFRLDNSHYLSGYNKINKKIRV